MTLQWLLGWWNLIYVVPFSLAMLYLVAYTFSGWTFGHVDGDFEADADADVDADADAESDAHVEAEHDVEHDQDHDAGDSEHESPVMSALTWLGLGKAPLSIILMVLLLTWGVIGFAVNQLIRSGMGQTWMVCAVSLPIAFIGSALSARLVSAGMAKLLPANEPFAHRRHELLGSVGTAILAIDHEFGLASVRDVQGNLIQVPCRTEEPSARIEKDSQILLVGYSAKEGVFHVMPAAAVPRPSAA